MLDRFTQRILESFHQNARNTVIPIRDAMKRNVNAQMNLGSGMLKLGTLVLLFFGILRNGRDERRHETPSTIVINNYLHGEERERQA